MALRSVHLTNAWHPASGGIRTFYSDVVGEAERVRQHVALIVPGEATREERLSDFGRLYTIRAPLSPVFDRRYRTILPHAYLRGQGSAVWDILARERPDIVSVSDKYLLAHLGGLIKRRAGGGPRPTLIGVTHERMDDNVRAWISASPRAAGLAQLYLRKIYLPQFDAHVANSAYTAAELTEAIAARSARDRRLHRLARTVHVSPPGVDLAAFGPSRRSESWRRELLRRAGGAADDRLIVHAGRLSPEKNVLMLPMMMALLARAGVRARLALAGDGPARAALESAAAEEAPGRVFVLGHLADRADLARTLASADVFVHANPREPFGIGPLEAMASGVPVVLPNAGGVLTYANRYNAWMADATPVSLAETIMAVIESPACAARRAISAVVTARAFAREDASRKFLQLFERIHRERLEAERWDARPPTSRPLISS